MATDINVWRGNVFEIVENIADEGFQRRAWFGLGPEQSSPDETVTQFFDNAVFGEFLARSDNGLSREQAAAGQVLLELMTRFAAATPTFLQAGDVIDDPRWQEIRLAAGRFLALVAEPTPTQGGA